MELIALGGSVLALLVVGGVAFKAATCTRCRDGWNSESSGRGTCSWHGGIDE